MIFDARLPLWKRLEQRRDTYKALAKGCRDPVNQQHYQNVVNQAVNDLADAQRIYRELDRWLTGTVVGHLRFPDLEDPHAHIR